jgi:hypothetical protein
MNEMDNQNVVCAYNGILFYLTGKELLTHTTAQMSLEDVMMSEII